METEDLPTPPLPEQTIMMCLIDLKRRATGVSCSAAIQVAVKSQEIQILRTMTDRRKLGGEHVLGRRKQAYSQV